MLHLCEESLDAVSVTRELTSWGTKAHFSLFIK